MILTDKKWPLTVLVTLCLILLQPIQAADDSRIVRGKVLDSSGAALEGAVVQIKNTRSLRIRSYISREDGSYIFAGLWPDTEYELSAKYKGRSSSTENVSQFDSSQTVEVNLVIGGE